MNSVSLLVLYSFLMGVNLMTLFMRTKWYTKATGVLAVCILGYATYTEAIQLNAILELNGTIQEFLHGLDITTTK